MDACVKELPRSLSAKYTSDFAYPTVKDRMPVILTRVVDTVFRMKTEVGEQYGQEGLDDLKKIVSFLSRLKNELQTNKPLTVLTDHWPDVEVWNRYLECDQLRQQALDAVPAWFQSSWLYVECYFYRRIIEAMHLSSHLKHIDPFKKQKCDALTQSMTAVISLAEHLHNCTQPSHTAAPFTTFSQFFHIALWGNKCDLSISAGAENAQISNPLSQLDALQRFILQNDSEVVWRQLTTQRNNNGPRSAAKLHIVLDNAGFELFTDLALAEWLMHSGLVQRICFHMKEIPWFVSDVTPDDWSWTLDQLTASEIPLLSGLAAQWRTRIADGEWKLAANSFWTLPHDFSEMHCAASRLYSELSDANLILLKGDLNYRKLVGDRKWLPTEPLLSVVRGFTPAPFCVLRTLKSDVVVGLTAGQAEDAAEQGGPDWMVNGSYAVIQLVVPP